jgi:hypothetical protein
MVSPSTTRILGLLDMRREALNPPSATGLVRRSLGKEMRLSDRNGGGTVA